MREIGRRRRCPSLARSCKLRAMRFRVKLSASLAAAVVVVLSAGLPGSAQAPSQPPASPASSPAPSPGPGQSSSTTQAPATTQAEPNSPYIAIDPLANVRYDNRYDISLVMAYAHIKAGPNLLQGANLGGLNLEGSY